MIHCAALPGCLGDSETCSCPCKSCIDARARQAATFARDRGLEAHGLVRTLAAENERYAHALLSIASQAREDVLGEQLLGRIARAALLPPTRGSS